MIIAINDSERIPMPSKQSSSKASSIAGKILAGKKPTPSEIKTLAASVLSQDEKKGSANA